jgi:hypothetical protein
LAPQADLGKIEKNDGMVQKDAIQNNPDSLTSALTRAQKDSIFP